MKTGKLTVWVVALATVFVWGAVRGESERVGNRAALASNRTAMNGDPPGADGFAELISAIAELRRPTVVHIDITGKVLQQAPPDNPFGIPFSAPRAPSRFRSALSGAVS